MRDNARRWLKLCPDPPAEADPWEFFKTCVRNRFESPNLKYFTRARLYGLKQRTSVTKYIATFQDLCSQIDEITEPEALQAFLMGLKPSLQIHFAGNPTLRENLSTVMQVAESLDNVQYNSRNKQPFLWPHPAQEVSSESSSDSNPESFPEPMELDTMSRA
ncbi:hypothetical protein BGX23_004438, partial [Mortierella sp. AD031]